jgi:hypothetical protein
MKRSTPFLAVAGGVALALSAIAAPAAYAATFPVSTFEELTAALSGCTGDDTVVLGADIAAVEALAITCNIRLELEGHLLEAPGVNVASTTTLTIDDSGGTGALTTTGLGFRPGITVPPAAALVIDGGTVTATGGNSNPGIGGGPFGAAGSVTITGGEVFAAGGGNFAAGIGGGFFGSGVQLTVTGGSVEAIGGGGAPGIGNGGGSNAPGASTTISGGTVVAPAAVDFLPSYSFGPLSISGTGLLSVPSGTIRLSEEFGIGITIGAGGQLVGVLGDETVGATISGDVPVQNGGVIGLDAAFVQVPVEGNNFAVAFDPQNGDPVASVRLFAPDFATGYRTIPAPPAGTAWNTAPDGSGDWFTADTLVTGDLTLFAAPEPGILAALQLVPSATSVDQGGSVTFVVTGTDRYGDPVDTAGVTLTSSVATDVIDGLTVTFPHASPHVITATLSGVSASTTIDVVAAPAAPPAPPAPAAPAALAASGPGAVEPLTLAGLLLMCLGTALLTRRRRFATR